jgi:hypothetical protein
VRTLSQFFTKFRLAQRAMNLYGVPYLDSSLTYGVYLSSLLGLRLRVVTVREKSIRR